MQCRYLKRRSKPDKPTKPPAQTMHLSYAVDKIYLLIGNVYSLLYRLKWWWRWVPDSFEFKYFLGAVSSTMHQQQNRTHSNNVSAATMGGGKSSQQPLLTLRNLVIMTYCFFWYLSSALTNNIAKSLFNHFKYPVTLSWLQFLFVAVYCLMYALVLHYEVFASQSWGCLAGLMGLLSLGPQQKRTLLPVYKYETGETFSTANGSNSEYTSSQTMFEEPSESTSSHQSLSQSHRWTSFLRMSRSEVVKNVNTIMPLTAFLISGHIFSSIAISSSSVSFVHTIKALSPLFTVLGYCIMLRSFQIYSFQIYISLLPLTFGVMLACASDITYNFVGFFCSLLSTVIFVLQNIFSKHLFQKKVMDKLSMLFFSSLTSFILMTPIWYYSEPDAFEVISGSDDMYLIIWYLFLNGTFHFIQNVVAFIILSMVSTVTYSIGSLFKRVVVIVASIIWFGQEVHATQYFGIMLTFVGLYWYNSAKSTPIHPLHKSAAVRGKMANDLSDTIVIESSQRRESPISFTQSGQLANKVIERIRNFDLIREASSESIISMDDETGAAVLQNNTSPNNIL